MASRVGCTRSGHELKAAVANCAFKHARKSSHAYHPHYLPGFRLAAKLNWVRLTWLTGTVATFVGIFILAVFVALLNSLTPTGRIVIGSRVVEVTPNVSGEIVVISVTPNVQVKAGTVLFQIDPAPFRYRGSQLEAALVAAEKQAQVLQANVDQASANVIGLTRQVDFINSG